MNHFCPHCTVN
jgi:hypothetical protein